MHVHFKCTYERVNETITRAKEDDQEIDYIELNWSEWFAFLRKVNDHRLNHTGTMAGTPIIYRGVTITRKEVPA